MFTAERVALLLLALAVGACSLVVRFERNEAVALPECAVVADSVTGTLETGDSAAHKKKPRRGKKKGAANRKGKTDKKTEPEMQRDHLREPVPEN